MKKITVRLHDENYERMEKIRTRRKQSQSDYINLFIIKDK
jgi:predicted CopG family antitoxin